MYLRGKKIIHKLSIFEICLISIILAICICSKYIDRFIPHIHPFHIIILMIGIILLRTIPAFILLIVYIVLLNLIFGTQGPTIIAVIIHILMPFIFLILCLWKLFENKGKFLKYITLISLIVISLLLYLLIMVIGDSEYTRVVNNNIYFWDRVWLALIYPGDWLNILITTIIAIVVIPLSSKMLNKILKGKYNDKYNN